MKPYQVEYKLIEIGKTIKSTKLKYIWEVELNGMNLAVFFIDSKQSKRKRVFFNNTQIYELTSLSGGSFTFAAEIDDFKVEIFENSKKKKFDLSVNGIIFEWMEQSKNKGLRNYLQIKSNGSKDCMKFLWDRQNINEFEEHDIKIEKKRVFWDIFDFEDVLSDGENPMAVEALSHFNKNEESIFNEEKANSLLPK